MGLPFSAVAFTVLVPGSHAATWDLEAPPPDLSLGATLRQAEDLDDATAENIERKRNYLMEVNFRGRWLAIPDSILDIWYFDQEETGDLASHPDRPKVRAWSAGIEYVVKNKSANGIFYFEYVGALIDEGYWDDVEDPPDYTDGDYIVPERLGLLALGANYDHEIHANEWLSFLFGGGIGVLKITGQMTQWRPGAVDNPTENLNDPNCDQGSITNPGAPAYERYAAGCGDDGAKRIPEVLPIVDLNLGVRFNFSDRANLRIEGGLHDLLYVGVATGVVF